MEKRLTIEELQATLGQVVDSVRRKGDRVVIETEGIPTVALVPFAEIEDDRLERERVAALAEQIRSAVNGLEEDEAMRLAVSEVAAHRYGKPDKT